MGKFFPKEIEEKVEGLTSSLADIETLQDCINITDYGVDLTGVADCTGKISQAISDAVATGKRRVYFPSGIYNGGMNNKHSNMTFIMGSDVKVKQVWHFAVGSSPLITSTSDPNHSDEDSYVENVNIVGKVTFIAPSGRLGSFMCKDCSVDEVVNEGDNYGNHFYFGTENLNIKTMRIKKVANYSGITGAVFIDNLSGANPSYRPKNVTIDKLIIDSAYLSGLYLNVDGVTIRELIVTGGNTALVGDAHNIYFKQCNNIKIDKIITSGCLGTNTYGLKIDGCTKVDIGYIESFSNQRGILITGNSDDITIGVLNTHDNAGYGFQCGGNGFVNVKTLKSKGNLGNGAFVIGMGGKMIIENINIDGTGANASYTTGFYYTNSTGLMIINKATISGYSMTGGKGFYADTVTGKTIIDIAICNGNSEGFNINNTNCSGFTINNIIAYNNSVRDFAPLPADTVKGLGVA